MNAYLDTHVAVWLYDGLVDRLTAAAKQQIEACELLVSPMVLLELQYLYDRKRIRVKPVPLYTYLNATFGINLCGFSFPAIATAALAAGWTRDPFDRIIVAHAQANRETMLITADTLIRKHYPQAIW